MDTSETWVYLTFKFRIEFQGSKLPVLHILAGGEVSPGEGVHLVQVHVHVIVRLHHKLRLAAELGHPEVAHGRLVAEVVVGVEEVPLHQVPVLAALLLQPPLQGGVRGGAWTQP